MPFRYATRKMSLRVRIDDFLSNRDAIDMLTLTITLNITLTRGRKAAGSRYNYIIYAPMSQLIWMTPAIKPWCISSWIRRVVQTSRRVTCAHSSGWPHFRDISVSQKWWQTAEDWDELRNPMLVSIVVRRPLSLPSLEKLLNVFGDNWSRQCWRLVRCALCSTGCYIWWTCRYIVRSLRC